MWNTLTNNHSPGHQKFGQNTSAKSIQMYRCSYCSKSYHAYQDLKSHVGRSHSHKYKEFIEYHERREDRFTQAEFRNNNYYDDETDQEQGDRVYINLNTDRIIDTGKSAVSPEPISVQQKTKHFSIPHTSNVVQKDLRTTSSSPSSSSAACSSSKSTSRKTTTMTSSTSQSQPKPGSSAPKTKKWDNYFTLPESESQSRSYGSNRKPQSNSNSKSASKSRSSSSSSSTSSKSPPVLQSVSKRSPLSSNTNVLETLPQAVPEPIGELILCTFCREKFYDPKYLAWHVHHEHVNESSLDRSKSSASASEGKIRTSNLISSSSKVLKKSGDIDVGQNARHKTLSSNSSSHRIQNSPKKTTLNGSARGGNYKCNECTKKFSNLKNLKRHVSMHQGRRVLTCKICSHRCFNIQQLREHQLKSHSDVYVFSTAGYKTPPAKSVPIRGSSQNKNTTAGTKHRLQLQVDDDDDEDDDDGDDDDDEMQTIANNCTKTRSPSESRTGMNRIHLGSTGITVNEEDMDEDELSNSSDSYSTTSEIRQEGMYNCPFCKFTSHSTSENKLKNHVRQVHHASGSPFMGNASCKYCNYKSKYPLDVLRHIRTHDEEKVFFCTHCPKKFREYQSKMKHEMLHKDNETTYPCEYCDKFYFHPQSVTRHIAEFHPDAK